MVSARRCPADRVPLQQAVSAGAEVHACVRCEGAWLPESGVRAVFEKLPGDHARWDRLYERVQREGRPSGRACVDCAGSLRAVTHRGVEVDVCASCGGIWFDGGELRSLVSGAPRATPKAALAAGLAGAAMAGMAGAAQAEPPQKRDNSDWTPPVPEDESVVGEVASSVVDGAVSFIGDLFSGL